MRRIFLWLFPFFVIGVVIYNSIDYFLIGAVITALFLIFLIKKYKFLSIFAFIFVLLGFGISCLHSNSFENKYAELLNSKLYSGYVIDKKDDNFIIKNYKDNYKVVLCSYKTLKLFPGDYVIFSGKVQNRPNYKKNILNSEGINAYIKYNNGYISSKKNNNPLLIPVKVKYKITEALLKIDKEGGSFISGLVTGYTGELSDDTVTNFQDMGISHILAVSGFNLGIIFYFTLLVTKRVNARLRYLITLGICLIYTAIGGFEPSIMRAFLMIFIVILAKLLNRYYDITNGITLAAFVMLLFNTFYIYNIGFLLSFSATYGITLLSKDIDYRLPEKFKKFKSEISVGLAAFISTLPIMLWFKGYFSIISILINILVSPIVGFATILSFLSCLLFLLTNAKIILYPAVFLGIFFIKLINITTRLNIMFFPGSPSYAFILIYYLLIAIYFDYFNVQKFRLKKKYINISLCILLVITFVYHDKVLKIHYINVGQGESIFIETPDRKGILIDTGPKLEDFSALKERVIPYMRRHGFNDLDALIFTHFHNDHAGDYPYLLDNFKVGRVIAYKKPLNSKYNFTEVSRGDIIRVGDVMIKVLYPEPGTPSCDDQNETCLVMEVDYKNFSMLLTGDAEKSIMDQIKGDYDVFNVSHHGSIKSFSTKMIDNSKIGIAVISVGKNNFGHPSKYILNYLAAKKIKTYRTDLDGDVTITTNGEKYETLFQ